MPYVTDIEIIFQNIRRKAPKIHCLTNPVTMQDVANLLLAAGGSAVMGQNEKEVAEITGFCQGTLLNTGVPDEAKINACILAGKKANELKHPVVLDPVGIGASTFRQKAIKNLLAQVHPDLIRCNQEEAAVLCALFSDSVTPGSHGGVESALHLTESDVCPTAKQTANLFQTTVLITGAMDVVSDGENTQFLTGGDSRICRITGGGCMLSALALYSCAPQIHRLMPPVPPELSGERSLIVPDSGQMPSMVVSELSTHSFLIYWKEKFLTRRQIYENQCQTIKFICRH